jgi:Tfp pilus assembly protein PilO
MDLRGTQRTFVIVITAALAVVGAGLVHYRAVSGLGNDLDRLERELSSMQAMEGTERATAGLSELRHAAAQFVNMVPDSTDLSGMLEELGRELDQGEALDREVATRPTIGGLDLSRIPVAIHFRGSFGQAFAVLKHVESSRRLTRLDRMLLERPPGDVQRPLKVEIEFSTFARTGKEAAAWAAAE